MSNFVLKNNNLRHRLWFCKSYGNFKMNLFWLIANIKTSFLSIFSCLSKPNICIRDQTLSGCGGTKSFTPPGLLFKNFSNFAKTRSLMPDTHLTLNALANHLFPSISFIPYGKLFKTYHQEIYVLIPSIVLKKCASQLALILISFDHSKLFCLNIFLTNFQPNYAFRS